MNWNNRTYNTPWNNPGGDWFDRNNAAYGGTPSNPAPSITTFSPSSLTLQYPVNTSASFSVAADQPVSSAWYLDGIIQGSSAQEWTHAWGASEIGRHNVTYAGTNGNGSVSITWDVNVQNGSYSPYDVNQDGYVNNADLEVIRAHFGEVTAAPYPRYDVNTDNLVDIYDIIEVSSSIPQ